jgi:hypothetical protein
MFAATRELLKADRRLQGQRSLIRPLTHQGGISPRPKATVDEDMTRIEHHFRVAIREWIPLFHQQIRCLGQNQTLAFARSCIQFSARPNASSCRAPRSSSELQHLR